MTLCITTQVNTVLAGKTAIGEETERPMAFIIHHGQRHAPPRIQEAAQE